MKRWALVTLFVVGLTPGFLLGLSGCWPTVKVTTPTGTASEGKPEPKPDNKPKNVEQLEKELAAAKDAELKSHQATEAKEKELAEAKIRAQQHKLYIVIAFCGLAFVLCLAGAIFLRGLEKYFIYGCVLSTAVAAVAYFLAAILPYLVWIVFGLIGLAAVVVFILWRFDHKALRQTVTAVETFKERMPGYKEHFQQIIDTDIDAWLDRTRTKLGLLAKKN